MIAFEMPRCNNGRCTNHSCIGSFMSHLELADIDLAYGGHQVVRKLSLRLEKGSIGCLLGPSGCGKTTVLRCIAGFEPVTAGQIRLDDVVVSGGGQHLPPERRRIGMVFQDYALFPHLSVAQNIGFGLGQMEGTARNERVAELLRVVGLTGQGHKYPHEMSGGQQQRVALARSLVMEPELLLLDEPFSALDAFTRASLQRDVRSIAKKLGFNLIIVTHDIDEAILMADRAVIMAGAPGKIVTEFEVPLPDPRQRQDPAVQAMRSRLMDAFHSAAGKPAGADEHGEVDVEADSESVTQHA